MDADWHRLTSWRGRTLAQVVVLPEIDSTNAEARRRVEGAGAGHGLVLVALEQTAGRGSRGRAWHHVAGRSLALSAVLDLAEAPVPCATWLGAVASADALFASGLEPTLKWPNDVLLRGRKFAGVLAETCPGRRIVVLGIGWNVGAGREELPADLRIPATSLREEGVDLTVPQAAKRLLDALDLRIDELARRGPAPLAAAFASRLGLVGRQVRVGLAEREEALCGRLVRIEPDATVVLGAGSDPGGDAGAPATRIAGAHVVSLRAL